MIAFSPPYNDTKIPISRYVSNYPLNNHTHEIEMYIFNESGTYGIPPTAITALSLENTIADWIVKGDLTVYYNTELAESQNNGFSFKNNGEDILRLRIRPLNIPVPGGEGKLNLPLYLWELNYIFAIYNIEDVSIKGGGNSQANANKKYRKFYFWDVRYQKMITKNISYSTATSSLTGKSIIPYGSDSDGPRSLDSDLLIYDIIKTSLNNDPLLSKTGLEQDPKNGWEKGSTRVFYTTPTANTAFDDLDYARVRHVSSTGTSTANVKDYTILSLDRGEGDLGYFSLRSISNYFNKSTTQGDQPGELQLEHFFLQADAQNNKGIGMYKAPISRTPSATRDIKLRDYNSILKYEFVDISPIINAKGFATTPVYSFDFNKRQYNVEIKSNSITTAKDFINKNYISGLFKRSRVQGETFLLDAETDDKKNNLTINPVYSVYGNSDLPLTRNPDGIHNLLRTGLFQNTCINFTTLGLTLREPGNFIAIDRPEGSVDGGIDDKLCGQWFVINVTHDIANGAYYNNITAVKINRYQPITDQQASSIFTNYVDKHFDNLFNK